MIIEQSRLLCDIDFIKHGFFGRLGGFSSGAFESLNVGKNRGDNEENVLKNRSIIASYFGVLPGDIVILNQTHSDIVHLIDSNNLSKYKINSIEGDAIITDLKNVLIGVNTADCVPLILYDKEKKYISVIHAGWKGAISGITVKATEKLRSLGCKNIVAAIGPSISKNSFFVGEEFRIMVSPEYLYPKDLQIVFDIKGYITDQLLKFDIVESVSDLNIDTFTDFNFFSHRRHTNSGYSGKCGVQFSGILLI